MSQRNKLILLFLTGAAFRFSYYLAFARKLVVGNDQMRNITLARRFAAGDFAGVLDSYWTPLYPFVIGIVSLLTDSLMLPSVIVSVIAGAFAVPLTYCLAKEFFGEREALIAAALAVFYPHLLNSFFSLGTENVYLLWMNAALLCCWRGLKSSGAQCFGLSGLFLGLAYLTRPEAFVYLLFFAAPALWVSRRGWQIFTRPALSSVGALMLGFFICAAPYLLYLHQATGVWTISEKANINTIASELDDENDVNNARSAHPADSETVRAGRILYERIKYNIITIHQILPIFAPPLFLMLMAIGFFREKWSLKRLGSETFLLLFCLMTIAGYTLSVVQLRYFYFLLPVVLGWTAHGIVQAEEWLRATLKNIGLAKFGTSFETDKFLCLGLVLIYFYTLPLNYFMRSAEKDRQINAYEERDAGLWIKEHSRNKTPRVFSVSTRPVFYAEGVQLSPGTENVARLIEEIKTMQPDYIVSGERVLVRHPQLKTLENEINADPEFQCVFRNTEMDGYQISVYKFQP